MGGFLFGVTLLVALNKAVLCSDWNLRVPQSIMAVSGSCVTIPCVFEVPRGQEANILNCSNGGVWKRGTPTSRNVFSPKNVYGNLVQGFFTSNLTNKNCTTVFHGIPKVESNIYFFRLECPNDAKFSFNNGVNIVSQEDLPPPQLTHLRQRTAGNQVELQCSVPMPCPALPPSLRWLPRDDSRKEQTEVVQRQDGQMTMVSTLTFTASADHHNQSVTCSASYPLTDGSSNKLTEASRRLDILYAPRFTVATLSVSEPVSEGQTVTFTCSSDGNPPVTRYTWFKDDRGRLSRRGEGDTLVLQTQPADAGVYLCEAQNNRGTQGSRGVSLEVATVCRSEHSAVLPYVTCGVVVFLYVLTVAVDVYKYHSLSRRLKKMELMGEHTYSNLMVSNVAPDYYQLQPRQPQTQTASGAPNYENATASQAPSRDQPRQKPF